MIDDPRWMKDALALAEKARQLDEVPVGALLVLDDQVIGEGWNQPITSSDPTAHAELMAIRDAASRIGNYRLLNTTLYVTLEPCSMCVGALIHARVKRLVFGAYDKKTGAVCSRINLLSDDVHNHTIEVTGGILEAECGSLLSDFFSELRARKK